MMDVAACVIGVIYSTPLFAIMIIPIGVAYGYLQVCVIVSSVTLMIVTLSFTDNYCHLVSQRYYIRTSRQLRRLSSKAYSPIYSHFSETITGCQTIRAYRHQRRFERDNLDKIEDSNIFSYWEEMADSLVILDSAFCVSHCTTPITDDH